MFDWNDEELGGIIWGEAAEVGDHIVPFPEGNEQKQLLTSGDHRKKQCIQEARPVKLGDQEVSGSVFSGSKLESSSQCHTDEARPSPGTEIDSWPDSPLTNVACDGEYSGRNAQESVEEQVSDFGTEISKYGSEKAVATQLDDGSGLFGNECGDKDQGGFLDYNWDNIGSFDDLNNMFSNDDPIFGRDGLATGELWSTPADLFSCPTKSFPTCSSNLGASSMCASEHDMKLEFHQHEDPLHTLGFGRTDHLGSYNIKNLNLRNDKTGDKECCDFVDPIVDSVGGKSETLLKEEINKNMVETVETRKTRSTSKVTGKRKLFKCPTKEEHQEQSSQDLHGPSSLTGKQFQPFGNQFATSSMSSQKKAVGPDSWLYWQTSNPYLSAANGNPQCHYPMMPTLPSEHSDGEKHKPVPMDYENAPGLSKRADHMKVFPARSKPPIMTRQEKLEKLKRRQQMQAMLAIQEQQQQFGHKVPHSDLYNAEMHPQENQPQDTDGSTIEVEENLKLPPSMESNSPLEHGDSNTVATVADDCSLEERVLDQFQNVIRKLDIKLRLCVRDSLFRLAQSATRRHTTMDIISTNDMPCNGGIAAEKDEAYESNRLPRISEVETETNPIDRTVAHLLFHQPLEQFTVPSKDCPTSGSPGFSNRESKRESNKNISEGCLSECLNDKKSLSHQPRMSSDAQDMDQFQGSTCISAPQKASNSESEHRGK